MRRGFLYTISLLPTLVMALIPLPVWLFWGHRLRWVDGRQYREGSAGAFVFELKPTSWFYRTFYQDWGGTTFGHVIMTAPDPWPELLRHEFVHVEQFDANALWGLVLCWIVGLMGHPLLGPIFWACAPALQYTTAGIIAVLRGESFYRGNVNEEAAYAIALEAEKKRSCRRLTP